jgi:hypothetical protein
LGFIVDVGGISELTETQYLSFYVFNNAKDPRLLDADPNPAFYSLFGFKSGSESETASKSVKRMLFFYA